MTRMLSWRQLVLALIALCLVVSVPAFGHTANGGTGDDTMIGHDDHGDTLNGGPGCDNVKGNGGSDHLEGGNGGCDDVRGGDGWDDQSITWDDSVGGDDAYGGAGDRDVCKVDMNDHPDTGTCEEIDF
jgi:hypothetical protein